MVGDELCIGTSLSYVMPDMTTTVYSQKVTVNANAAEGTAP